MKLFRCDRCNQSTVKEVDITTMFFADGSGDPVIIENQDTFHLCKACVRDVRGEMNNG